MHIPDGYLSPSTCAGLYAASAPFWYASLRRLKATLHTRLTPLLSVFSAFSFVIMMFNLPLPGGTTGHAVGMGVAAIVLGPWASIAAISIALLIQAIFFGDGGVTAIGANCFNMAVAGSLVSFAVYRAGSYRAPIGSVRRVVAAGLAGYVAINVAALFAAIEFGIQPLLFHDASGSPLYAPYPLSVSIPAMMAGHLTIAGMAELVISAGMVAWLQRTDAALLARTAPDAPDRLDPAPAADGAGWPTSRKLWLALAVLLVLTPAGILAVGSAWGEWTARDFADPQARAQIATASRNQAPPRRAPSGLERLESLWTAPIAGYAPGFIRNASLGYLASALAGVGLIVACGILLQRAWGRARRRRRSFLEKTGADLAAAFERAFDAEETASAAGFLQELDPRVKLVGIGSLILAAVAVHKIPVLLGILAVAGTLASVSGVGVGKLWSRVWIGVLVFTGAIALPAVFLTPGEVLVRAPVAHWPITRQGLTGAAFLVLRAETTATLAVLLILTTLWSRLLKALRFFRVPVVVVVLLGMTYRYIFLFLRTAQEIAKSREARQVGTMPPADRRRLAAATAGVLLGNSLYVSGQVHAAMQARGFRGEVHLFEDLSMGFRDWIRLAAFAAAAGAAIVLGR